MSLPDETVMAYVDGELDDAARAEVEATMAADPTVRAQVEAQLALRKRLRASFDSVLSEPVPERLRQAVRGDGRSAGDGVADLSATRATRQAEAAAKQSRQIAARRWSLPQFGAIAASLVIGVLLGQGLFRSSQEKVVSSDGSMVAGGALDDALTRQLASNQSDNASVQIGLSYKNNEGAFCRTFALREDTVTAGVACRSSDAWRIEMLEQLSAADSATYRTAGAELPASVRQAVEKSIAGEPLDADAEGAARESGWR